MKKRISLYFLMGLFLLSCDTTAQLTLNDNSSWKKSADFSVQKVNVNYHSDMDLLVFEITVSGQAGNSRPQPVGSLDGAPVLGYVFPTNLKSTEVGFNETEGIVALALTSHPDFDDTPLWDENSDNTYDNDGIVWHPHWVLLTSDDRVPGGLSVKQFEKDDERVQLPPTNPGMPMYMDSPGFSVVTQQNTIKALVPVQRAGNNTTFSYDGVAAYMQVNTSKEALPLLGVYQVYSVASGDLSLPYSVTTK